MSVAPTADSGAPVGVALVDKPPGMTSHDVVSLARRRLGTRRIGHAGTLDPAATGLLILGVGPATRLLTHLVGLDKSYLTTIRLGASTSTDDAEGETTGRADPARIAAIEGAAIEAAASRLTGTISQVPSSVSAIKVAGRRAYERVRAGEDVALEPRTVTVHRFAITAVRAGPGFLDVDAAVDCSTGTYVRALARDLGAALGVGGHVAALRRRAVGPFAVSDAVAPADLTADGLLRPGAVAAAVLAPLRVAQEDALALRQGRRIPRPEGTPLLAAALDGRGELVAVVRSVGGSIRGIMTMPDPVSRQALPAAPGETP